MTKQQKQKIINAEKVKAVRKSSTMEWRAINPKEKLNPKYLKSHLQYRTRKVPKSHNFIEDSRSINMERNGRPVKRFSDVKEQTKFVRDLKKSLTVKLTKKSTESLIKKHKLTTQGLSATKFTNNVKKLLAETRLSEIYFNKRNQEFRFLKKVNYTDYRKKIAKIQSQSRLTGKIHGIEKPKTYKGSPTKASGSTTYKSFLNWFHTAKGETATAYDGWLSRMQAVAEQIFEETHGMDQDDFIQWLLLMDEKYS